MSAFGFTIGFIGPILLLIGKVGLTFAAWRLVSEIATTVRYWRKRFIE